VVALNRAVAVSMAEGPAAGLAILDALEGPPSPVISICPPRGDCLRASAAGPSRRRLPPRPGLTRNRREQAFFAARVEECERAGAR
jgi:predicted RNA polymerase sigma factor